MFDSKVWISIEYKPEGGGTDQSDYEERAREFTSKYGKIKNAVGGRFENVVYNNTNEYHPKIWGKNQVEGEDISVESKQMMYGSGLKDLTNGGLDEVLKIMATVENILIDKGEFDLDGYIGIFLDPPCDVKTSGEKFKTVLAALGQNGYNFSGIELSGEYSGSKESVNGGNLVLRGGYTPKIVDTYFGSGSLFDKCSRLWIYFK
jgi:hypothetical protein